MVEQSGLQPFGAGIWLDRAEVRTLGFEFTSTMTLVRLGDGSLLVYSPIPLTAERRAAVEALGPVEHLYAPSLYHHLWLAEWAAAFPRARVHAPRKLGKKHPGLRIDRAHGPESEPAFAGVIEELHIEGCRLDETVLFVRPAGTLIVADLVHNVGRPNHIWTKFYMKSMGFYDRVALSRVLRWTAFADRRAARKSVDELLALPFDALVVGHGAPIADDARTALASAYGWLA